MRYREHPVPGALAGIVEAIWTLEAVGQASAPEAIVPDGHSEIVVHFGDAFERRDGGTTSRQASILVAGQIDRPLWLRPTGRAAVLGVRLTPAGLPALLAVPACELTNLTPAVADVEPRLARWLEQVRETASTPDEAAAIVCQGLQSIVGRDRVDPRVAAATRAAAAPGMTVEALASLAGVTRRQLERLFQAQVGLAPRTLLRIRRLQRATAWLEALAAGGSRRPGIDAAAAGGYADQAHFVREFAALTGATPSAHLLRQAELTGVFLGSDRRTEH